MVRHSEISTAVKKSGPEAEEELCSHAHTCMVGEGVCHTGHPGYVVQGFILTTLNILARYIMPPCKYSVAEYDRPDETKYLLRVNQYIGTIEEEKSLIRPFQTCDDELIFIKKSFRCYIRRG